jgi:hypothetical protein
MLLPPTPTSHFPFLLPPPPHQKGYKTLAQSTLTYTTKAQETQHGRDKENTTYSTGQNSGYNIKRNYGVIGK